MSWKQVADQAKGWLYPEEGLALQIAALVARDLGPFVEIGGYCGKSACYLGAVAQHVGGVLFSVDWHRGSPEMVPGRECHDPDMMGPDGFDSLPHFRRNVYAAGLEPWVIPIVGDSTVVGRYWSTPIGLLFIDGAHDAVGVRSDFDLWAKHIVPGGYLIFHDATIPHIGAVASAAEGFDHVDTVGCMQVMRRAR